MKIAEISLASLSMGFSLPNETISAQSPPLQRAYTEELENVSDVTGSFQKKLPKNSAEYPQSCLINLIPLKPTIKQGLSLVRVDTTLM